MRQENIIILLYKGGSEIQILNGCLHRKAKLEFQPRRSIQVNSILAATGSNRGKDNLMWTGKWEPKPPSSHWNLPLLPCQEFTCWTHVRAHFAATCYFTSAMMSRNFLFMNHDTIFWSFSATGSESWRKLQHHPWPQHQIQVSPAWSRQNSASHKVLCVCVPWPTQGHTTQDVPLLKVTII